MPWKSVGVLDIFFWASPRVQAVVFTVIDSGFCKELQIQTDFNTIWKTWLRILTFSLWNDAEPPGWCLPSSAVVPSLFDWFLATRRARARPPPPSSCCPRAGPAARRQMEARQRWAPGRKMAPAAVPEEVLDWEGCTHDIFNNFYPIIIILFWFWYPINRKRKSDSCYLKWNGKVIYTAIFLQDVVSCSKHSIKPLTNFSGA